ncbi:S1 family peptidase [Streptomyces sp. NPDC094448]|uniref:S1 family peptidase n=1 Tax=Streptomyces sp. NPDC094448 TaxID=3366063 RepID=UPI003808FA2B
MAAPPPVIGGKPASITTAPYTAFIRVNGYDWKRCGGTIVAPRKIVTAAHCVRTAYNPTKDLEVFTGRTKPIQDTGGSVAKVIRAWVHPDYNQPPNPNNHDIAVLTLDRDAVGRPLALPAQGETAFTTPGTTGALYGWGLTRDGDVTSVSDGLLTLNESVLPDRDCTSIDSNYNASTMLCAAGTPGTTGFCSGDSGGPLVIGNKLAGVIAFSYIGGCATQGKADFYMRASAYTTLINQQINTP